MGSGEHLLMVSSKLTVTKVNAFQGEVYNSWIFLFYEVVLCESFIVNNEIWRKLLTIEPTKLTPRLLSCAINNVVSTDPETFMRGESSQPGF